MVSRTVSVIDQEECGVDGVTAERCHRWDGILKPASAVGHKPSTVGISEPTAFQADLDSCGRNGRQFSLPSTDDRTTRSSSRSPVQCVLAGAARAADVTSSRLSRRRPDATETELPQSKGTQGFLSPISPAEAKLPRGDRVPAEVRHDHGRSRQVPWVPVFADGRRRHPSDLSGSTRCNRNGDSNDDDRRYACPRRRKRREDTGLGTSINAVELAASTRGHRALSRQFMESAR